MSLLNVVFVVCNRQGVLGRSEHSAQGDTGAASGVLT